MRTRSFEEGGASASPNVPTFARARSTYEMARSDAEADGTDFSDEECELLGGAQSEATFALLLVPAPDLPAFLYKLETFAAEDCFALSPHYREPLFAALIADVRRLAGMMAP
jgi:hypothetical protein